ncbi:MAG: adenylyl-sulfate kinase, partial [Pseudoxanthomonas suwonensis]
MPARSDSATQALQQWLQLHEQRDLLRLITCGSVDDGKSTLIGRLLHDTQRLRDDQIATLANTRAPGDAEPDYSRLLDGLSAEREQGITIDVAYRYVDTERRKFIIADCPGHAQYTRNMATGASTAQLAIVLVDARHGLLTQTRRHSYILALLGVPQVLLAVNKMDLVDHDQAVFERIAAEYRALAAQLGLDAVTCIPISALHGDNLAKPSAAMPWYHGPTLLQHLETVPAAQADASGPLRLPVQRISRDGDARALEGTLASGSVQPGDAVVVLPSGQRSHVRSVRVAGAEQPQAQRGQAITVTLADTLDVGRGDLLVAADAVPALADQFAVQLLWMDTEPLLPGRL